MSNAIEIQVNQPPIKLDRQVSNLKFHNLCTHLVSPLGIESILLGYDLKHWVQHETPQNNAEASLDRLECEIQIRFLHHNNQQESDAYDEDETYETSKSTHN
jgi:hypothetical protein